MSVRKEIASFREQIVNRARFPQGFTADFFDVYRDGEARHQGLARGIPENAAWDSYLYISKQNTSVVVILQYLNDEYPECQRMQLRGENGICEFALRLCIYDIGAPAPGITDRNTLYERLLGSGKFNTVPGIALPHDQQVGDAQVGHIVDLPIPRQPRSPWQSWVNDDVSAMTDCVHKGAIALLPIAAYYVENKRALFGPRYVIQ